MSLKKGEVRPQSGDPRLRECSLKTFDASDAILINASDLDVIHAVVEHSLFLLRDNAAHAITLGVAVGLSELLGVVSRVLTADVTAKLLLEVAFVNKSESLEGSLQSWAERSLWVDTSSERSCPRVE